jgi:hypothetical protein
MLKIKLVDLNEQSWIRSVSKVSGYVMGDEGSIPGKGRESSLRHSNHISCGACQRAHNSDINWPESGGYPLICIWCPG